MAPPCHRGARARRLSADRLVPRQAKESEQASNERMVEALAARDEIQVGRRPWRDARRAAVAAPCRALSWLVG